MAASFNTHRRLHQQPDYWWRRDANYCAPLPLPVSVHEQLPTEKNLLEVEDQNLPNLGITNRLRLTCRAFRQSK